MLCTTVTKSSILPIKFAHLTFCLNGAEDKEHRHKFFDQSYAFAKIQCKVQHEIFVNRLILSQAQRQNVSQASKNSLVA